MYSKAPSGGPSGSARGTVATSLLAEVATGHEGRLLAGISGASGSGKGVHLDDAQAPYRPPGVTPLSQEDITAHAAAALGIPAPQAFVDKLAELTGGMPWLVYRVLGGTKQGDRRVVSEPLVSREVMQQLGDELDRMDGELRHLILALSVGFDLTGGMPPALEQLDTSIDTLVVQAHAAGLLLHDGQLIPLVRQALLETTPAYRVRALQRTLVDMFVAEGRSLTGVARNLARSGLKDPRIARSLERAGDRALSARPGLAATLYEEAIAAGSGEVWTAARRAQAASATGDLDGAGRILDHLLVQEEAPDLTRAVDVAAAVWAQRGMLERGADVYRWLGPARAGSSASLAAVAMLGTGDRDGANTMLETVGLGGSPTHLSVAMSLMGQGIRDSVDGNPTHALSTLIHASDMMTASGVTTAPLPDVPAALAALLALHSGDLDVADSIITDALDGDQGGSAARPKLLLLRA